jgi:hypothetical protein
MLLVGSAVLEYAECGPSRRPQVSKEVDAGPSCESRGEIGCEVDDEQHAANGPEIS